MVTCIVSIKFDRILPLKISARWTDDSFASKYCYQHYKEINTDIWYNDNLYVQVPNIWNINHYVIKGNDDHYLCKLNDFNDICLCIFITWHSFDDKIFLDLFRKAAFSCCLYLLCWSTPYLKIATLFRINVSSTRGSC